MVNSPGAIGVLRVVGGADTTAAIQQAEAERAAIAAPPPQPDQSNLAAFLRDQFELMRRHRDNASSGWAMRLLQALRAFNGQYDPDQLAAIRQFRGSEVYARVIAMKCRGASSLLRDVYLGADTFWGLSPDPNPEIPAQILQAIQALVHSELASAQQARQQIDPTAIRDRIAQLTEAARQAAKNKAAQQAKIAEDKIEQILDEGGFYTALAEFITDLPLFPYACIKGPSVRLRSDVKWANGKAQAVTEPRLVWTRVSPFDIYWTPGVSDIADGNVIERSRLTRSEINDLLDLPGYNVSEVRAVLDEYGRGGLDDNWDLTDAERAVQENRENPRLNRSGLIACLEFQGYAQGRMLLEAGMDPSLIQDELRDYFVQAWLVGRHVIKVQLAPSPRKRHQYFVTSFEKVPGTPVGNGLPDILTDIQTVCNATLRALVNNLSIASGPQVTVNTDRLADGENAEDLYPWKRWYVRSDPLGNNTEPPIQFFMPSSISQELMAVYSAFTELADEMSAIPRYMTGAQAGAIGRTASGLSMLMSNSSKILQTVAANVDRDIMEGVLTALFDMILLTDTTGLLTGEEDIRVMGVNVAVQKETQRARQLEFLQITANPLDAQIVGPKGRATILREVASTLGMPGAEIVPSEEALDAMQKQAAMVAQQQGQPGHGGMGGPAAAAQGNQQNSPVTGDVGPRTNIAGGPQ
jgi:hypothetical protein